MRTPQHRANTARPQCSGSAARSSSLRRVSRLELLPPLQIPPPSVFSLILQIEQTADKGLKHSRGMFVHSCAGGALPE